MSDLVKELKAVNTTQAPYANEHVTGVCQKAASRIEALEAALSEAYAAIEFWGSYASEYFKEKHDLAGDMAKASDLLRDKP